MGVISWTKKGFIPFKMEILTPVFIGSGEDLSPLDYVLGKQEEDNYLYRINLDAWLRDCSDKSVLDIIETGDLRKIRKAIQNNVSPQKYAISKSEIDSSLRKKLLESIENLNSNSTNEISANIRNPLTGNPYIPGSSIKGAISTAIIDFLDSNSQNKLKNAYFSDDRKAYTDWFNKVFGNIGSHAMKAMKVSDVSAQADALFICTVKEEGAPRSKQKRTPKAPVECIKPGTVLWGRFFIAEQNGKSQILLPSGTCISYEDIAKYCKEFYMKRFIDENKKFYLKYSHLNSTKDAVQKIYTKISSLGNNEFILRVGHYSHIECVTISDRDIDNRSLKKKNICISSTTRSLANGVFPFGWVKISSCSEEEFILNAFNKEKELHLNWEKKYISSLR